ncbi:hypothetical protein PPTG_03097 [Phytophthora nicotianae INRA-310]|uniref:Uncharacterized protein n=1 Tax=Phytophthora nicotianae (strain INRA-310) TaxID=761204 RepID=W2R411_PHYN3|nr:hypothetical protein PPTG_03097 [Phytophthora nicotianae INRA-310]ETN19996.1 hypothetical protein PPTG_03097 [Phytophthora nicotianae INRA-310]
MAAHSTAEFTVTSGTTEATTSSTEHVSFVKQWTLNSATNGDNIDSIDLDLAGRVYVSYVSGLPSGVLGYVNLEAQNTGTICISAQTVTATNYEGRDASRISMPNASSKFTSTGTATCDESTVPAREPACVSSACAGSSTSGTPTGTAGSGASTTATVTTAPTTANDDDANDDDTNDDTNASSVPHLAALAAAAIGAVTMALL